MTKAVQVNDNALALAEYKLDGGQVLNNNTVKITQSEVMEI